MTHLMILTAAWGAAMLGIYLVIYTLIKWRRAAQAEGRSHHMTEASFVDGLVIRMREAYWRRVRALQLTVPKELFARAPVERWRGTG